MCVYLQLKLNVMYDFIIAIDNTIIVLCTIAITYTYSLKTCCPKNSLKVQPIG